MDNTTSKILTLLSEELLNVAPEVIEITLYNGRLPKMTMGRATELLGHSISFCKVIKGLCEDTDVFVTNGDIHILHTKGIEIIPKTLKNKTNLS